MYERISPHRALRVAVAVLAVLIAAVAGAGAYAVRASAATGFHEVTNFGANPGNLRMFAYVPPSLPAGAPVVVLFHGCGGQAQNLDVNTGWRKYADAFGFALVMPEQKPENVGAGGLIPHKCFSAWNQADRTRAGQGEALSVVRMVQHLAGAHSADLNRVFVTGYSGGGAATNVMLAAYPDFFRAGAVFFGMAYGCADTETAYFTTPPLGQCSGPLNFTGARTWGDRVRSAYPGYTGPRPKVQLWHGSDDPVISPRSLDYQRDQWTDVFGVSRVPASTTTPVSGVTKRVYGDGRLETYTVSGMGHQAPVDPGSGITNCGQPGTGHAAICGPYYASVFFGLA
ncbi:PHB depolymerase family esterase [Actinocorallia sp. A-T 12471]|uniref:extracellular catalytic domain type 1 short-chain-length polyhydroxyalkanoate depolymerase n=1 Tax=Actinocorallia sp. A-T 12471 TaxID=3089813 RepID=UPI0029CCE02F|nr:PHB depolymerase family esterase [Actinocorallia sp. A-T 12471]MDX6742200.1 PHB depolymerase family esterase [Actinocorallia sp. A-T 12471]